MDALSRASWVHYHRGDSEAATQTREAAVALGRAPGFSVWPEYAVMLLARLKVDQERVDEGAAQAEGALPPDHRARLDVGSGVQLRPARGSLRQSRAA